jgi:hypothetical protein
VDEKVEFQFGCHFLLPEVEEEAETERVHTKTCPASVHMMIEPSEASATSSEDQVSLKDHMGNTKELTLTTLNFFLNAHTL